MSKTAKFAGARIVFTFSVEDEEGDVETYTTQEIAVSSKEWRRKWATDASGEIVAQAIATIEAPEEPAELVTTGASANGDGGP